MTTETKERMESLLGSMDALQRELRNEAKPDSDFCARQIGTAIAMLQMQCQSMYGIKLLPACNAPGIPEPPDVPAAEKPKPKPKPRK